MEAVPDKAEDYVIRVYPEGAMPPARDWDALVDGCAEPTPFVRHAYLDALHASGSACADTGWASRYLTLWSGDALVAACPLYLKTHSFGEYVFDWAWAEAHARAGLRYYPKALCAVPFTPVPGPRLLARGPAERAALLQAVLQWCRQQRLSSFHLLFGNEDDIAACVQSELLQRHTIQFHWQNAAPTLAPEGAALPPEGAGFPLGRPGGETGRAEAFEGFLATLTQDKRKKIRQERRKVAEAGVTFRHARGAAITPADWAFFYRCYERTYLEHGNLPYLQPDFFDRMARTQAEAWVLFIAERNGQPIASSLIAVDGEVAYGRYWGALERVDCLHFEACYYQPIAWCLAEGIRRFEGGAQGEHKMARALLPVRTSSAHWLAHPGFAQAVERFLDREGDGVQGYLQHLAARSPLRRPD
ncbi:GNAT family N-acetyltransferase [Ramlibacter sp.]|uniref:GNAT family N-acetyltransferase n=1 Tax=Ramlibacter sp. TaxID=1917967 RepID=UPI0035B3C33F